MDYVYFQIEASAQQGKWGTAEIEAFLEGAGLSREEGRAAFLSQDPFLSIAPLNVRGDRGWSDKDYDQEDTNYIAIVTSDDAVGGSPCVSAVLDGLADLLNAEIHSMKKNR